MAETMLEVLRPQLPTLANLMSKNLALNTPQEQLLAIVEQEIENLNYVAMFNPKILECNKETIKYAMRKVIMQNLSFDPDLGLIYLTTRQADIDGRKQTVLEAKPTVNGEISILRQAGVLTRVNPPIVQYDDKGYVIHVHVELIVPQYDTRGNIVRQDILPFNFGINDFRNWQRYSHMQNRRGKDAGQVNNTTMNWANENYYNYYPENPGQPATPDKPGGIQPGFAITKAFRHAMRQAKLDNNPYAKRVLGISHEKYVDPAYDTVDTEFEVIKDNPAPVPQYTPTQPAPVVNTVREEPKAQPAPPPPPPPQPQQEQPKAAAPVAEVVQPTVAQTPPAQPVAQAQPPQQPVSPPPPPPPPPVQQTGGRKNEEYYKMVDDCNTADEIRALYSKHVDIFSADKPLVDYLKKVGNDRTKNPRTPAPQAAPQGGGAAVNAEDL